MVTSTGASGPLAFDGGDLLYLRSPTAFPPPADSFELYRITAAQLATVARARMLSVDQAHLDGLLAPIADAADAVQRAQQLLAFMRDLQVCARRATSRASDALCALC